ncbi:hypothetical protein [Streptomyces sp. H39-S7]|uniref:hypothetical protein n=1 Tax=Streptomyces sp. H39-S7 TaxID=3004357 RepID=UPI0022AFF6A4|nr:hypothetical protein [Streptomyces sp. H39-S7]MCZ4117915.1 hypothetical protein [Streptomyces sp. H39-S7]
MTRPRAEVGDLVEDQQGRRAIVTDIKKGKTWVLRPPSGSTTAQWESDDPDSLRILEPRPSRPDRNQEAK